MASRVTTITFHSLVLVYLSCGANVKIIECGLKPILIAVVLYPLKREQKVADVCQNWPFSPLVERYPSVATSFYRTINLYKCQPWRPYGIRLFYRRRRHRCRVNPYIASIDKMTVLKFPVKLGHENANGAAQ